MSPATAKRIREVLRDRTLRPEDRRYFSVLLSQARDRRLTGLEYGKLEDTEDYLYPLRRIGGHDE